MKVLKLSLRNFRNHLNNTVEFSPGVNVFLGKNGQGKTNLLEALYLLSNGDTFRPAENASLITYQHDEARLQSQIVSNGLSYDVEAQILKTRKHLTIARKRTSLPELREKVSAILFSPESLSAIKGGADERRQLLDEFLLSLNLKNSHLLADFRKCLKTRNRILRDYQDQKTALSVTEDLLAANWETFLKLSVELTFRRLEAIENLTPEMNHAMRNILGDLDVEISVEYVVSGENASNWKRQDIAASLTKRAADLRSAELATGGSLVGPQKHDVRFLFNGHDSRYYCSQGQQRALILALKLAQIVYHRNARGEYPLLLLDDVLSELDSQKREALIQFLRGIETQIFITTTDIGASSALDRDVRIFSIDNGQVVRGENGH